MRDEKAFIGFAVNDVQKIRKESSGAGCILLCVLCFSSANERIHSSGGVSGVSCRNTGYCGSETQQLSNVSSRSLGLGAQECIVPKRNGKERSLREASGHYPPGSLSKVSVLGFV